MFVIETKKRQFTSKAHVVCIEVKMAETWDRKWEQPMRSLNESDQIKIAKMIGIYTGKRSYHFDGVNVLPVEDFFKQLYNGEIF